MTAIPGYMLGPYNQCVKQGWLNPGEITNNEFITIFKKACNAHQGKGEHARYADKVMKKFAKGSINGSTITPLRNGLSSLVTPRRAQAAAVAKKRALDAAAAAAKAAKQREAEINRLRGELANVRQQAENTSQTLVNCQNALINHQVQIVNLNRLIAQERGAKEALEVRVNGLIEQLQTANANVQALVQQLGEANNERAATTQRLEQRILALEQTTNIVAQLGQQMMQHATSLNAIQTSQVNTNNMLQALLQAARQG